MDRPLAGIVEPPAVVTPTAAPRVIVSNRGGRQLDGGMATLDALPAVARAVGNRVTVMMDGGVRRGAHVVKALAMGAKAVLVGRATLYGVAAAGEPGALRALEILRDELARTMQLCGVRTVGEIGPDLIARDAEDR
jgi:(S)-mandelate dehydrogenase